MDEFGEIARLFRPLTEGAPEALQLLDDAAAVPSRPGHDLVVTKDAVVEGVHFLPGDPPDLVARKLLRVNLSDLAAKAAEPYAYLLAVAWPPSWGEGARALFAQGLAEDQAAFGVKLLGGDTVSTPGPFMASLTLLGWTPSGAMVKRSGAGPGDVVLVSGTIGDGGLGLKAARGELTDLPAEQTDWLIGRYRLPQPRIPLRRSLRAHAAAAADVSDGLLGDAGHIGEASGAGIEIRLEAMPLSPPAAAWLANQPDRAAALVRLATAGDDYEVVCTARPDRARALAQSAARDGLWLTPVGQVVEGGGVAASYRGRPVQVARTGWRHT